MMMKMILLPVLALFWLTVCLELPGVASQSASPMGEQRKKSLRFQVLRTQAPRAQSQIPELSIGQTFEVASDALTTEKVWDLDPGEENPHRRTWILERKLRMEGLEPVDYGRGDGESSASAETSESADAEFSKLRFGIRAQGVFSKTRLFVRPASSAFYKTLEDFPCTKESVENFFTSEGTQKAGNLAAAAWEGLISKERLRLSALLARVRAPTGGLAFLKGVDVFSKWLDELEEIWRFSAPQKIRQAEWAFYWAKPGVNKRCQAKEARRKEELLQAAPSRSSLSFPFPALDIPASTESKKFLARAPARRWDGLYTIRLSVEVGDKILNGQFLLDTSAPRSLLSPIWLQAQGVRPALLEITDRLPQKVIWSGGEGVAPLGRVAGVKMGGISIPLNEFFILETERFLPPSSMRTCCDGVLGTDFLRLFSVEFYPGPPTEVRFWERSGFSLGLGVPSVEVVSDLRGSWKTPCEVVSERGDSLKGSVRFDTGSFAPLLIHEPWKRKTASSMDQSWSLQCEAFQFAKKIPAQFPEVLEAPLLLYGQEDPSASIGMGLLGRDAFTLDLSHGRIWFSKESLGQELPVNKTGLQVRYRFNAKRDRVLRVERFRPGGTAQKLFEEGLKPGVFLTAIDSRPVEDMDQWEVDQRLAGAYGKTIVVQWKTARGVVKMAPLTVR